MCQRAVHNGRAEVTWRRRETDGYDTDDLRLRNCVTLQRGGLPREPVDQQGGTAILNDLRGVVRLSSCDDRASRQADPGRGSCCGGRRCAPTPLRCSVRGRAAKPSIAGNPCEARASS